MNTIQINNKLNQFTEKAIKELKGKEHYYHSEETRELEVEAIREMSTFILKDTPVETAYLTRINNNYLSETRHFLADVIREAFENKDFSWVLNQKQFFASILEKKVTDTYHLSNAVEAYLCKAVKHLETKEAIEHIKFIHSIGHPENEVYEGVYNRYDDRYLYEYSEIRSFTKHLKAQKELKLSKAGKVWKTYLQENPSSKLFDYFTSSNVYYNDYRDHKLQMINFLKTYFSEVYTKSFVQFTRVNENYRDRNIDFDAVYFYIELGNEEYAEQILNALANDKSATIGEQLSLYFLFNEQHNGKYDEEVVRMSEKYLKDNFSDATSYGEESLANRGAHLSEVYFDFLKEKEEDAAFDRIALFFKETPYLLSEHFTYLSKNYKDKMLPLLLEGLKKDKETYRHSYYYFDALVKAFLATEFDEVIGELFDFAFKCTLKEPKDAICGLISRSNAGIARCFDLTKSKKVKERAVAVQVLNKLEGEQSLVALAEIVELENNDDSRDSILQKIHHIRFEKPFSKEKVEAMIEAASLRKKLSKWGEKKLEESSLPELAYVDGGVLDEKAIRFLFYRMKRAKGVNSDIEAKQLLQFIDKEKASKFAKVLIQAFKDANADTKIKYYLTLAGLLGDDQVTGMLITLFNQSMRDKRMKMCEYILGALAMVGSDKALRQIDQVYRKYMNKKPSLAEVAKTSLVAAAKELNITLDDLADRIIPDFDFEDNFKTFEVEGEEYRAFINSEFKLNYLNEDNKSRKSLPKGVSAEVKKEFKEIEKGIKEAVKGQTLRLERYLVEERRWKSEEWQAFFFNNPILFVYASQLLWGVFDEKGALVESFYCDEDMCFYNAEGDEVELEEEQLVGILHPLYLSEDQLSAWKELVYDNDIQTVFPILDRKVFKPTEKELEGNTINIFDNKKVPKGASFVGTYLVKKNWRKEASDGGSAEFYKDHISAGITAHPYIEGPMMYYMGEEEAIVGTVYFGWKGRYFYSVSSEKGKKKFTLKDVPAVFFSEVMADIQELLDA